MSKWKKLVWILGGGLGLLIAGLLLLPVFWSVDQIRPRVQEELSKSFRAPVELGAFSLRLFPKFSFRVDGIQAGKIQKWGPDPLLSAQSASINMSLWSLVVSPKVELELSQPKLTWVQRAQESNLKDFLPVPPSAAEASPGEATSGSPEKLAAPAVGTLLDSLPGFLSSRIRKARISVLVDQGRVALSNLSDPSAVTELSDFSVSLQDIGIGSDMKLLVDSNVLAKAGGLMLSGPVAIRGTTRYEPVAADHKVTLMAAIELAGLEAKLGNLFSKTKGSAFALSAQGNVNLAGDGKITAAFDDLGFQFGAFVLKATLQAESLENPDQASFRFEAASNDFDLGSFGVFVPLIREYQIAGKSELSLKADGALMDPAIQLNLAFNGIRGATPALKKPLTDLNGRIAVSGTAGALKIDVKPLSLKLGSSDLSLESKILGPLPARIQFAVKSKNLDADELLGLQPVKLDVASSSAAGGSGTAPAPTGTAAAPALPLDESLHQLAPTVEAAASNPLLSQIRVEGSFDFNRIRALGADFENARGQLRFTDRVFEVSKTQVQAYSGRAGLGMAFDLKKPAAPRFEISGDLQGVDFGSLLATHAPSWKNDFFGKMNGKLVIQGEGLRREQLSESLGGSLNGSLTDGRLRLPLVKIVGLVMERLPKIVGKNVEKPSSKEKFQGDFKTAKMDLRFVGRSLRVQNVDVVYDTLDPKIGDLRFLSTRGQVSFDQKVDLEGIAFLSPEIVRIGELQGPSGQIEFPLRLSGPMTDASPDLEYTLGILGPRVAKNLIQGRVGQEAKKAVAKEAEKQVEKALDRASPEVKKKAEDLKKQLKKRLGF
jgi:hypothetical protein